MHVDRVVAVVDCGMVVNPDTVEAQMQSGIIFGITAALWGEITIKNGRVEQTNFDDYRIMRIDEAPKIEVEIVKSSEEPGRHRRARHLRARAGGAQRGVCRDRRAVTQAADQRAAAALDLTGQPAACYPGRATVKPKQDPGSSMRIAKHCIFEASPRMPCHPG